MCGWGVRRATYDMLVAFRLWCERESYVSKHLSLLSDVNEAVAITNSSYVSSVNTVVSNMSR